MVELVPTLVELIPGLSWFLGLVHWLSSYPNWVRTPSHTWVHIRMIKVCYLKMRNIHRRMDTSWKSTSRWPLRDTHFVEGTLRDGHFVWPISCDPLRGTDTSWMDASWKGHFVELWWTKNFFKKFAQNLLSILMKKKRLNRLIFW